MGRSSLLVLALGLMECGGSSGPTPAAQERALQLVWEGQLDMSAFPRPKLFWFTDGDCEQAQSGTPLVDGKCFGATIGLDGNHVTSDADIPWPGYIAPSQFCWSMVTLSKGILAGELPLYVANDDHDVVSCSQLLASQSL